MRVVVIGGTGHIGTFLIPRLVNAGHDVIVASRGKREPYVPHAAWNSVRRIDIDRAAEDAAGTFGARIAALEADAVVDLICFTPASAQQLVDALEARHTLLLHCGTMWVHGRPTIVPTTEEAPRHPFGDYGIQKAAIERLLLESTRLGVTRAVILHPGHLVGPGWKPLNPAGHFNPDVFTRIAHGELLQLPNEGMETVHHVHADDVAQAFELAITHPDDAVGESFHVVSPAPLTLRAYAEGMFAHFGQRAQLRFLPWDEWRHTVTEEEAAATWDHIAHSPHGSIAKARQRLGYAPRYTSIEAVIESVNSLIAAGELRVTRNGVDK
ncbi:MAG: NAD-dependent epimerase/dehydratase family protein [Gemmatimonadota bacterium]|nr:NAD-dependent epimerase/dehydratase family protein [Gemmatimonadota bacterium]